MFSGCGSQLRGIPGLQLGRRNLMFLKDRKKHHKSARRSQRRRRLLGEQLEQRLVLAGATPHAGGNFFWRHRGFGRGF